MKISSEVGFNGRYISMKSGLIAHKCCGVEEEGTRLLLSLLVKCVIMLVPTVSVSN